ncbi:MAG: hypothetical protein IJ225_10830 [Solobacterium sp.]|nr:hypothetical protein [Solobacterium sp.]
MLYSTEHQQALAGWLKANNEKAFNNSLKLQKFLFFYEAFCETFYGDGDFNGLRGYEKGPVFSAVYGDFTYDYEEFSDKITIVFNEGYSIKEDIAKKASFIVSSLTNDELSNITHFYDIWKKQESAINAGVKNITLDKTDFTGADKKITSQLVALYPDGIEDTYNIVNIKDLYFLIEKNNYKILSDQHKDALEEIAETNNGYLHNPVYIELVSDGGVIIDA